MALSVTAKAIVPKPFNVGKIRSEIAKALQDEGKHDREIFNKTVEAWTGATPTMAYRVKIEAQRAWVWIGPLGSDEGVEKWIRLDEGAEPHPIVARRAPKLVFPWQGPGRSYNPKTRPTWLGSRVGAGQKYGPIRKVTSVNHPGHEARYWSLTLLQQRIVPFAENIQAAINRGLET